MVDVGKRCSVFLAAVAMAVVLMAVGCSPGGAQGSSSADSTEASSAQEEVSSAAASSAQEDAASSAADASSAQEDATLSAAAALPSWTEDSPTVALVEEYVADVTDESSLNYIPPEDRIVTIDWDGTLYGELDPIYFDWAMYVHRTLWDSTYTPTAEQVEVAHAIEQVEQTRSFPEDLEARHAKCLAEVFAGMTVAEFKEYVAEFADTPAPKFNGMKRADAYFLPMVELVNYLHDSGFECFIVSGTDRNVLRVLLPAYFPWLDDAHIKGSVSTIVASGQDGKDGLDYTWTADDEAVLGGELVIKDVKANKPTVIATEIGKQPVMSLGNSSGDSSMANFAMSNEYRSLALMLCCDDTERDWGETDKASKMAESCEKNGWHAVSQRDEWKTIYGDDVTRDEDWTWSSEQAGPNQAAAENVPASESSDEQEEEQEEELPMAA